MNTLERIATGDLPMTFVDKNDIEIVESLAAAGYIRLSAAGNESPRRFVEVIALTKIGEAAATRFLPASGRQELPVEKTRRKFQVLKWALVSAAALCASLAISHWGGM